MRKTHKILSVVLAVLMIISIIPITASAYTYSGKCGANLTWEYDSSTYTLTISGTGAMYDYDYYNRPWESYEDSIKTVVINDGVTTIVDHALAYCDNLTTVTIPDSVTTIGDSAFYCCYSLTSVTIPDSVTTIRNWSFSYCHSLTSITIGDSVTTIGDEAFYNCVSLTSITIPDSVTTIGTWAFNSCTSLTSITIPDSVTTVGTSAFYNTAYYNDSNNWENDVLYISNHLIEAKDTLYGSYTIKNGTKVISYCAFWDCTNLTSITIPNSVTTIGDFAFGDCTNLTSITIPDSVTTIGDYAFYYCTSLTSVTIPDSVIEMGVSVFRYCGNLTSVIIGEGITTIDNCAFEWCHNLTSIVIPDSVVSIGSAAFDECYNLKDVYFTGTQEQWDAIAVGDATKRMLNNATIHYNYHMHKYNAGVTEPTCTEQGYTTYTCECGDSYVADYVNATGHSYTSKVTTPATHTATGVMTYTCACGDSYTEVIEKLEKHNYEIVVTVPTCTEQGYTTYTCECGDTYIADYVDELGHTEETIPAVAPNCTEIGLTESKVCSVCGETLTEQKELPANGHTPANAVEENCVAPTCTENGSKEVVVYCSVCDEEISRETVTIEATGHADNDGDGYCDTCPELLDPTLNCDCNCHKSGISKFFFNLILFFQKLFGSNKTCACGVAHY